MNHEALKIRYSRYFLQTLVFEENGNLISSCDSLFATELWLGQNLYQKFPLLGSLQDAIHALDQSAKPISLPAVEMNFYGYKGIFDFDIYVHPSDEKLRVWMILDNTPLYRHLQEVQQERNLLKMENEDLRLGRQISRR